MAEIELQVQKPIVLPVKETVQRRQWKCLTWTLTWWIPTVCIRKFGKMTHPEVIMAWREKVALCIIIMMCCGLLLFYIIGLGNRNDISLKGRIICPKVNLLSQGELDGKNSMDNPYVGIYGNYYKIPPIVKNHVTDNMWLNEQAMEKLVLGQDVSAMFFKTTHWDTYCPGLSQPSGWDNINRNIPDKSSRVWMLHNGKDASGKSKNYISMIKGMLKGQIARDKAWIDDYLKDPNNFIITAYGKVYDVTTYMVEGSKVNFLGSLKRYN